MYEQYTNIYALARKGVGLTQERAAERLGISVESIKKYENDVGTGRIPPESVVLRMCVVYDTQYLMYQHALENSKIAGMMIPANVRPYELAEAILRLQKEVTDFVKLRDEMIDITYDNVISEDERPRWEVILKELNHITAAIMNLKFVPEQKEPENGSAKILNLA